MRQHEFLSEDELFEINMSPSNLKKLVQQIPQALVGLEFEMIVPDANVGDDDDESEADYDEDERCRSISDIVDFFCNSGVGGDYNSERRLRESLQDSYQEWLSERMWDEWNDVAREKVEEYLRENTSIWEDAKQEYLDEHPEEEDADDRAIEHADQVLSDNIDHEMENQDDNYDSAREEFEEEYYNDDHEDDWLDSQGYRYMTDVEGRFDETFWPYRTSGGGDSNLDEIADSFGQAVGREVKFSGGYHDINRNEQASEMFYILEPDGSLNADSGEAGLEFVSPPMPVDRMMTEIGLVAQWAEEKGAYTGKNAKTGLHMNISVPNYSEKTLDYVKLALLLGDNHILKEFDRMSYTYARSSFDILDDRLKSSPDKVKGALEAMKGHFDIAASKSIHSGSTDKYTSINVKNNRVEFRGPGGNYLQLFKTNPDKLFAPLMRFVVALEAACDPEKYREEYQKKLYKFLSKHVKSKDALSLFSDYAAGKGIPQSAYKSFLKQRKSERNLAKGIIPGDIVVAGRKSNPDGSWILFKQIPSGDMIKPFKVEVLYRFNAVNDKDAEIVRNRYAEERNIATADIKIGSDPTNKYGQPTPVEDKQDDGSVANWGLYRKNDGTHMKYNGEYVRYENMSKEDAEHQKMILFRGISHAATSDYELRKLSKYEIYNKDNGRAVVGTDGEPLQFEAGSPEEADQKYPRILRDFNISGNASEYEVRGVLTPPAHTTTTTGGQAYNVRNIARDQIVRAFLAPNSATAIQKFHDWIAQHGLDSTQFRLEAADANASSTADQAPVDTGAGYQSYTIRDVGNSYNITNFPANNEQDAIAHFRRRIGGDSGTFELRTQDGDVVARSPEQATAANGAPQATATNGVPMWSIYRISDGEVVHRFAEHPSQHSRTALSWLRDNGFTDNPSTNFRVRAMSQDEQEPEQSEQFGDPRQQPNWEIERNADHQVVHRFHADGQEDAIAKAFDFITNQGWVSDDYTTQAIESSTNPDGSETWEIFNMNTGQVWNTFQANSYEQAEERMERMLRSNHMNSDMFDARIHRPNRARTPQSVPAPTGANYSGPKHDWEIYNPEHPGTTLGELANATSGEVLEKIQELEARLQFRAGTLRVRIVQAPREGEFWWKIEDSSGQVLHKFTGVGDNQGQANEHARNWLSTNPNTVYSGELSVVPLRADQS